MSPGNLPDIFLDTDVAFDIISKREPFFESSVKVLELAAHAKARLMVSGTSMGNLFYLTFDIYKIKNGVLKLTTFIEACHVAHATKEEIKKALNSDFKDKDDALQYYTALSNEAEFFVTRNIKDYKKHQQTNLPVFTPTSLLENWSLR